MQVGLRKQIGKNYRSWKIGFDSFSMIVNGLSMVVNGLSMIVNGNRNAKKMNLTKNTM